MSGMVPPGDTRTAACRGRARHPERFPGRRVDGSKAGPQV